MFRAHSWDDVAGLLSLWLLFVSSASLFTLVDHSGEVCGRTYLERPRLHAGMLRHQLNRVIQVAGFQDKDAADLLLRFGIGAVGDGHLAILPAQGCRRLR